ncbi:hypothetical protein AKJ16_DCAP08753 [Drosera capensis]
MLMDPIMRISNPPVSSFNKAKRKRQDTVQMLNEEESKPPSPLASSMKTSQHGHEHDEQQQDPKDSGNMNNIDPSIALKNFLERVPISSNSVIDHSSDLADSWGGGESDLIAPVTKFADRYIGFVDFPSMLLWGLEAIDQQDEFASKKDAPTDSNITVFSMLQKSPRLSLAKWQIWQNRVWQLFFPVHLEVDTLLHVLLLPLKACALYSVIHLLLQASGLEWFDSIANKTLLEFRFEHEVSASQVYGDQSVAEVLDILWHDRANVVVVGEQDIQAGKKAGSLNLRDNSLPGMDSLVTH